MQIPFSWITIIVLVGGALAGRELWLHISIAKLQRDVSWIVKYINKKE